MHTAWYWKHRAEVGDDHPMVVASDRCSFQLTYARANDKRLMLGATLDGPELPDAYDEHDRQAGEWYGGDLSENDDTATAAQWIDHYAGMAVAEAVHEALEWFRVDGQPWLDPHGHHEAAIHAVVGELTAKLTELRPSPEADS